MGPPLPSAEGRLNDAAGVPAWKPCFSNDCRGPGRRIISWATSVFLFAATRQAEAYPVSKYFCSYLRLCVNRP